MAGSRLNKLLSVPVFCSVVLLTTSAGFAQPAEADLPSQSAKIAQLTLPPIAVSDMTVDGRSYSVFVMRPAKPAPPDGFPLLVVLDANADFATAASSAWARSAFSDIAPIVVVGIGYPDANLKNVLSRRAFDFTSSAQNEHSPDLSGMPMGGAEAFRNKVVAGVLARMDRQENINPRCHVLFGHSLGGLFVVDTLFRTPEMFEGYFAASPALHANDFEIFNRVPHRDRMGTLLPNSVRLHLVVGQREAKISARQLKAFPAFKNAPDAKMVSSVQGLSRLLTGASSKLQVTTEILPGESHLSEVPRVLSEAVTFTSECPSAGEMR